MIQTMDDVIFGFHPVRELLRHRPHAVSRILIAAARGHRRAEIEQMAARHGIAFEAVPTVKVRDRAGSSAHNGFLAELKPAGTIDPAAASAAVGDLELEVLVEDVEDPRNLGALLRVCEGAGVGRVWIRDRGSAPITATVAKVAAGATEWLAIERVTNAVRTIEARKADGFWVFGASAEGEAPWSLDLSGKVLLCIGGEKNGLRAHTRAACDHLVGLPMRGRVGSLNLSTAAAGLLYEAVRQRAVMAPGG